MDSMEKKHLYEQISTGLLVCIIWLDFVHICSLWHIWSSSSSCGKSWLAQDLENQWLKAYMLTKEELAHGAGAEVKLHPPLQICQKAKGGVCRVSLGVVIFPRAGTQESNKNLIPGTLSALLHADSPHKNQTVHLDARMWRMFHSLIGMKQSAERWGRAAPQAKAWQLMSSVEAGGCPSHFPTSPLLPGYTKLCFAESQVLGLCYV